MRRSQLVLPPAVDRALELALAQSRHARVLFDDWGLGTTVTYGRGTTMLFSGSPGVGKTAAAEALAHELGKDILAVSYAEVQNAYIGQTEKNIVRIFHQARQADAVLFWDEADAMFTDRRQLRWQHEIRDTNVLLQEIERFEGTCILATNRSEVLDAALDRRISIKVEFDPPDEVMRRELWRKLIPAVLPLAEDVELDALASRDMTGGQIKNAVLNAAREALVRGPAAKVTREDFERAIGGELGRGKAIQRLGFA